MVEDQRPASVLFDVEAPGGCAAHRAEADALIRTAFELDPDPEVRGRALLALATNDIEHSEPPGKIEFHQPPDAQL